jgi:type I restriction enzyme, S subunit
MAGDGNELRLGDVVALQRGTTYKSALLGLPGPVLLGLASIKRNGGFRDDSLKTYGGESPEKLTLRPGDIYVSLKDVTQSADLLGAIARVPPHVPAGRVTQDTVKLTFLRKDIPSRYVYWLLRTPVYREYCRSFAIGTTNLSIAREDFLAFPVPRPKARELTLVEILDALDDKIELNRRMNATLEAMARALFQSWFVDFDPVRAKLDGRNPVGLDKATAAQFPTAFQDSPLGPIPKGWIATTLGEACRAGGGDIQTGPFGTQLHAADYVPEGIPSIMPSDLRDNRIDPTSISRIREKDAERLGVYRVEVGDVVYSRRGDVERRSLIRRAEDGWLCGTGCLRVRFGVQGLNSHFGASYLGTLESRAWVVRHAVGATMPNLNTSILGALPMVVPPPELQSLFGGIVGPWDERGTVALEESRSLADLRDTLLPKLLSGELRVASVEQIEEKIAR